MDDGNDGSGRRMKQESPLGRWAKLKKNRSQKIANVPDDGDEQVIAPGRGGAAPVALEFAPEGDYRPWLPPLSDSEDGKVVAALTEGDPAIVDNNDNDDDVLSAEELQQAEDMGLPAIEDIKEESDFSAFMANGVPEKLKRLALRRLWSAVPLFGFRDGMNDYDEDFTLMSDFVYNSTATLDGPSDSADEGDDASPDEELSTEAAEGEVKDANAEQAGEQPSAVDDESPEATEVEDDDGDDDDGDTDLG